MSVRNLEALSGQSFDRRASERTTALFRPALIDTSSFQSFCLVRNISSTGLMATLRGEITIGQKVEVRFDEANFISGTVVWTDEDRIGIFFDQKIDVDHLLVNLSECGKRKEGYRSPRLKIEVQAKFLIQSGPEYIVLQDISQRGGKALTSWSGEREGEEGTIAIPGMQPRKAVVRWVKEDLAGFYFLDPISFCDLGEWVLSHNQNSRPSNFARY